MGQYWKKCVKQVVSHWYYSLVLNYGAQEAPLYWGALYMRSCSEEYLTQGFDHLEHFL